jgi:hypothetical protein
LAVPHIRSRADSDGTIIDAGLRRRVAGFLDAVLAAHEQDLAHEA